MATDSSHAFWSKSGRWYVGLDLIDPKGVDERSALLGAFGKRGWDLWSGSELPGRDSARFGRGDGPQSGRRAGFAGGELGQQHGLNGDGTFGAASPFAVGVGPNWVAVGDFNGDGAPDLAVANQISGTVSVLLGHGDGTFQSQTIWAVGSHPHAVAVGDFNGDGAQDLAVTNLDSDSVSVLLGNGDGTFQEVASLPVGRVPREVVVGDFNGDGAQDLAVVNQISNTVSVLLGNGDGTFRPEMSFGVGPAARAVAVGDFNRDGLPDLVVGNGAGRIRVASALHRRLNVREPTCGSPASRAFHQFASALDARTGGGRNSSRLRVADG